MATVLRMPGVAADAADAVLADWLVADSEEVAVGQPIATVETEKAAVDIEAETAGRMLKLLVPSGARVEVGEPIAVLGAPGETVSDLEALLATLGVAETIDPVVPERRDVPELVPELVPATSGARIFASPLVRKLAGEAGVPLTSLTGSGPRGRIVRRDLEPVLAARSGRTPVETPMAAPTRTSAPASGTPLSARAEQQATSTGSAPYEEIPHSRLRRAVARRLTESKQTAPHFYLRATVRAGELMSLRSRLNADAITRLSVNDFVVRAVAAAHARVPEMNVTWSEEAIRQYSSVDVALAVATARGLLTPVLRDVTSLPISSLAAASRDLADRARAGRLRQDELEGGTITVTNLGMYGVEEFAAIINPPQAAILAVGAVREAAVVVDGSVVSAEVITLTLSVDHRPVDGVLAARWLAELVDLLQDPVRILR